MQLFKHKGPLNLPNLLENVYTSLRFLSLDKRIQKGFKYKYDIFSKIFAT